VRVTIIEFPKGSFISSLCPQDEFQVGGKLAAFMDVTIGVGVIHRPRHKRAPYELNIPANFKDEEKERNVNHSPHESSEEDMLSALVVPPDRPRRTEFP
jgi:hypothetical protein